MYFFWLNISIDYNISFNKAYKILSRVLLLESIISRRRAAIGSISNNAEKSIILLYNLNIEGIGL